MAKATTPAASAKKAVAPKAPAPKAVRVVKPVKMKAEPQSDTIKDKANDFVKNASDKARDYATTGKDKATMALGGLGTFVEDIARSVDDNLGSQYGDYARKAASAVNDAADTLKNKSVDDIVGDTRKFVREKPAIAIGAAAVVGFLLTRLFKAGSADKDA
jgi:ElaB/YqjD/DUF883 family membrane-anchored ribosome-binding protein